MLHPLTQVSNPSKGGEVAARPGVRTKVVLPDGTQVWLNSNSKLKYSPDFNLHSREVDLEGEAYFDVAKDMERPFIVHASTIDVRVLGTAFTIKSYPQDETIEATLLKGAIEISGRDNPGAPRIILKPDEKLVLNKHWLSSTLTAPAKFAGNVGRYPSDPLFRSTPSRQISRIAIRWRRHGYTTGLYSMAIPSGNWRKKWSAGIM